MSTQTNCSCPRFWEASYCAVLPRFRERKFRSTPLALGLSGACLPACLPACHGPASHRSPRCTWLGYQSTLLGYPSACLKLGVSKLACLPCLTEWGYLGHGHQVCVGSSRSGASKRESCLASVKEIISGSRHIKHMQFTVLRAWRLQEGVQPRFRTRVSSRQATSLTYTGASGGLRFGGDGTSKSPCQEDGSVGPVGVVDGGLISASRTH